RLADAFERTYDRLYGRTPPEVPLQVVSWRVRVASPAPDLRLAPPAGDVGGQSRKGERLAYFPELGGFVATPVYDRYCLRPGDELNGAAIVEERESTVIIAPGARACVDQGLNLIVEVHP